MKTLLKSAFILALTASVTSCDFFGKEDKKVGDNPAVEIPVDSAGELKTEEKKEVDSAAVVPTDSTIESKEKKETK